MLLLMKQVTNSLTLDVCNSWSYVVAMTKREKGCVSCRILICRLWKCISDIELNGFFLPYVQPVLTGFFIFLNPGIRGRGGRGHDHTCQLRGRLRLNSHSYTHKSRTKRSHSPCWDPTQGLSDKSTDSGCFFPSSLFILKSVWTLEGGVVFHTRACDGSVK